MLLPETLARLAPRPGETWVDCTLGGGGHAAAIAELLGPGGRLIALDQDETMLERARTRLAPWPATIVNANFDQLKDVLDNLNLPAVDGVLADLGFSSMQVDDPDRGFSFMRDGPLDMRMDRSRGRTAADVLNEISLDDLTRALVELGDEPQAETIARALVNARDKSPFHRTSEVRDIVRHAAPVRSVRSIDAPPERKQLLLPTTRVFQTLRILVNRELANLEQLLRVLPDMLKPGASAAILTFHSGEDRLVKAAFRSGAQSGLYDRVSDDPLRPTEAEKASNPRSRSAKLRVARRALSNAGQGV